LKNNEWKILRSQNVIAKLNESKVRFLPYVFTEQGVAMLAAVLNSQKAIDVNVKIMRAFVKLRHYVLLKDTSNRQVSELKKLLMLHIENNDYKFSEHDDAIKQIVSALNNLITRPPKTRKIGFNT